MREIKAIIRRERVPDVISALHERPDLPGVTISYVEGVGRRAGGSGPPEYGEVQMAKVETVVPADLAPWVVDTIKRAAFTGRPGDGRSPPSGGAHSRIPGHCVMPAGEVAMRRNMCHRLDL